MENGQLYDATVFGRDKGNKGHVTIRAKTKKKKKRSVGKDDDEKRRNRHTNNPGVNKTYRTVGENIKSAACPTYCFHS